MSRGKTSLLVVLVETFNHLHSEWLTTIWDLLITNEFLENTVDARGKFLTGGTVATWINHIGTKLGNKACCCQHILLDSRGRNALAQDRVPVAQMDCIDCQSPIAHNQRLAFKDRVVTPA